MNAQEETHEEAVPAPLPAYTTLKAVIRYDGATYAGWQVQPDETTVQGCIEAALSRLAKGPVRIHGASRTDAGVHAFGQVFSWQWPREASLRRLQRSLCKMLGPRLRIESIEPAPDGFHARKSAHSKRYAYVLHLTRHPDPFLHRYAWAIPWELDLALLDALAARITGTHDFAGFQCRGSSCGQTVRTLFSVSRRPGPIVGPQDLPGVWRLELHGDGFLYKMVRNLVGTLVYIARGNLPPEHLETLLHRPGPYHGYTAPPHGLFLKEVLYPDVR